jgi:hypothetical protein
MCAYACIRFLAPVEVIKNEHIEWLNDDKNECDIKHCGDDMLEI